MKTKKFNVFKSLAIVFAIFTLVFMVALYFTFRPESLMSFMDKILAVATKLHITTLAEGQSYLLFGAFGSFIITFIFMCIAFGSARKTIFVLKGGIKGVKKDAPQVVNNYFVNSTETNLKKVNKDSKKKEKGKKIKDAVKAAVVETKEETKVDVIKTKNRASNRVDDIISKL